MGCFGLIGYWCYFGLVKFQSTADLLKGIFIRHVLQNHVDLTEVYHCPKCEATFTLERNLERHIKLKHRNEDEKVYKCCLCDFKTGKINGLCTTNLTRKNVILTGWSSPMLVMHENFPKEVSYWQTCVHFHVVFNETVVKQSLRRKDKLQKPPENIFSGQFQNSMRKLSKTV